MQNLTARIIPFLFVATFSFATVKKVNVYDKFALGAKKAVPLALDAFPYLSAIFVMLTLFDASGVSFALTNFLSPVFAFFGIPKELTSLVLIKPFSGTGSLSVLAEVYAKYSPDSFIGKCASVIYSSTDTVFYMSALYYSDQGFKKLYKPLLIGLLSQLFSALSACAVCLVL